MKLVLCALLLFGCGGKDADGAAGGETKKESVLAKLEALKPMADETYDFVQKSNEIKAKAKAAGVEPPAYTKSAYELPPTPSDTLAHDVRTLAFYDLGTKLDAKAISAEPVKQVIELYMKLDPKKLRGLRGGTHQAFVKSLTDAERKALVDELVDRIKTKGFLGADQHEGAPPPMSADAKAALGGGAPAAAPKAEPTKADGVVWAGKYKTTEGAMTLHQIRGSSIVGGEYAKGRLACTTYKDDLDCKWTERGTGTGQAVFKRDASGNFTGTWGWGKKSSGGGKWNGMLVEAASE